MALVLPDDILTRVSEFVIGKKTFPFIEKDELVCIMYLYGRTAGIRNSMQIDEVTELAQRTAGQMANEIERYAISSSGKLDSEYIRSRYLNRQLQLTVEKKYGAERLAGDPTVQSECFSQHLAYHKQDYFFGLYGPFKENELTADIRPMLEGRMVMVSYNRKSEQELGSHPLIPVYIWFKERAKSTYSQG